MNVYTATALLIVLIVMIPALILLVYYSWRNGISPLPASASVRDEVSKQTERVSEQIAYFRQQEHDRQVPARPCSLAYRQQHAIHVVEAGSGWGTLALRIVAACPDVRLTGLENSPLPLLCSRLLARLKHADITFRQGDLYAYDYAQADVIVCYLFPRGMNKLSSILRHQCRAHTYVISVYFALPNWEPERVIMCQDWHRTPLYVYRCGHQSYLV